jgi:hypothetical protein
MTAPVGLHRYSFRDYLAVEQISTVRHEFLNGEIYAIAGGSILHARLFEVLSPGCFLSVDRVYDDAGAPA